jgi:hypothetical protein
LSSQYQAVPEVFPVLRTYWLQYGEATALRIIISSTSFGLIGRTYQRVIYGLATHALSQFGSEDAGTQDVGRAQADEIEQQPNMPWFISSIQVSDRLLQVMELPSLLMTCNPAGQGKTN